MNETNRESLADDFHIKSSRVNHTNTCLTSIAPAEQPSECNCAEEFVRLYRPNCVLHEYYGPHGLWPKTYQVYPDNRIFRAISDLGMKSAKEAWESAARNISENMETDQ